MLRQTLLRVGNSSRTRSAIEHGRLARPLVRRFVAGPDRADAVEAAATAIRHGLAVSLDHLGEDVTTPHAAAAAAAEYRQLLADLAAAGLTADGAVEVSVKLSSLGAGLSAGTALRHATEICADAAACGTTVTVDMEDHTTTEATLAAVEQLRGGFDRIGVAVQSALLRTEADCRRLAAAAPGARVRLCKGAYRVPDRLAQRGPAAVDLAYARCLRILFEGGAYPMVATHDSRLISLTSALAARCRREPGEFEFQLLHGVRQDVQQRLADRGHRVRVYLPYGRQWYPYLLRRIAERPANLGFAVRALRG